MSESDYHNLSNESVYLTFRSSQSSPPLTEHPKTPISQYSYFVRAYNYPCNMINGIALEEAENDPFFEKVYPYGSKQAYAIRFCVPLIILIILYILSLGSQSMIWLLFSSVILLLNLAFSGYLAVRLSNAADIARRNRERVSDPLSLMIYSNILCKKKRRHAAIYEISLNDLYGTGLSSEEIELLKKRVINEKVEFMAYNDTFKKWSQIFEQPFNKLLVYDLTANLISNLIIYSLVLLEYLQYH